MVNLQWRVGTMHTIACTYIVGKDHSKANHVVVAEPRPKGSPRRLAIWSTYAEAGEVGTIHGELPTNEIHWVVLHLNPSYLSHREEMPWTCSVVRVWLISIQSTHLLFSKASLTIVFFFQDNAEFLGRYPLASDPWTKARAKTGVSLSPSLHVVVQTNPRPRSIGPL